MDRGAALRLGGSSDVTRIGVRESGLQTNCTVSVIMADMSDGEGWTDMETILKQKRQGKNHGLKEVVKGRAVRGNLFKRRKL